MKIMDLLSRKDRSFPNERSSMYPWIILDIAPFLVFVAFTLVVVGIIRDWHWVVSVVAGFVVVIAAVLSHDSQMAAALLIITMMAAWAVLYKWYDREWFYLVD